MSKNLKVVEEMASFERRGKAVPGQGNNAGKSLVRKNAACLRNLEEADVVVAEEIRGELSVIHRAEFEKLRSA